MRSQEQTMKTDGSRHKLQIQGAMSTRGADRAGQRLATAALVLAWAMGVAAIIYAARWW